MADTLHIEEQLRGLYPNSQKLTTPFIAEMGAAFKSLSNEQFDEALAKHRAGPEASRVPLPKALAASCGQVVYRESRLAGLFMESITLFGWDEAVRRAYQFDLGYGEGVDNAIRDYLIRIGINASVEPFFGFPFWCYEFFCMLHDDEDVIGAYLYASQEAPGDAKLYYARKHRSFEQMGNDRAKTYFTYFKTKHREDRERIGNEDIPF